MGDNRLGEFLRARREQVQPHDVGLAQVGRRRVAGLRREEVALLAGVSADYYVRLEQGRDRHPSAEILDALGKVLRLEEAALRHLHALARPQTRARRAKPRPERAAPELVDLLRCWSSTPAMVMGRCLDVLAYNAGAAMLYDRVDLTENLVRSVFLDPATRELYRDWDRVADDTVGTLRASASNDADNPRLIEIVGELSIACDDFRRRWSRHEVHEKTSGLKRFQHHVVGELDLRYDTFSVNAAPGQLLVTYHAQPGTAAVRALDALLELARRSDPEAAAPTSAANGR